MRRFLFLIFLISLISLITPTPVSSAVVLNEITPNPSSGDDWVELYNTGSDAVDISGWILDDSGTSSDMLTIPSESTMSAQSLKVFYVSNRLNQNGDTVYLFDPNRNQKDSQDYGSGIDTGKSLGRYGDGGSWQTLQNPTPGSSNSSGNPLTNPSPSPSPSSSSDPSSTPNPTPTPTASAAVSSPTPKPSKRPSPSPRSEAETLSEVEGIFSPLPSPKVLGAEASPSPSLEPKKSFALTKGALVSYSLVGSGLLFILGAGIPLLLRHLRSLRKSIEE